MSKKKTAEIWIMGVPTPHSFTYLVPERLTNEIVPGYRVIVPFGKRVLGGIVTDIAESDDVSGLKEILDLADPYPLLSIHILKLAAFVSRYYFVTMGTAVGLFLPLGMKLTERIRVSLIEPDYPPANPNEKEIILYLAEHGSVLLTTIEHSLDIPHIRSIIYHLERNGALELTRNVYRSGKRTATALRLTPKGKKLGVKALTDLIPKGARRQRAIFHRMLTEKGVVNANEFPKASVDALVELELLERVAVQRAIAENHQFWNDNAKFTPTDEQQKALNTITDAITQNKFTPFLLHGLTGSGKTLVYIEAARKALEYGKGVLIMVPEIALTPQLWGRFSAGLDRKIAILHSGLTTAERRESYLSLRRGDIKVALGARSAIAAPIQNLGLIVVDEEHESSYKQHSPPPYYNARDMALVRGRIEGATVILGSATPSVESYYNALQGKYTLLELTERVRGLALPSARVVDMRVEREKKNRSSISKKLAVLTKKALKTGEKAILLLNRRGYSSFLLCPHCGNVPRCPDCDVTLTYHIARKVLLCHTCGLELPAPTVCPRCGYPVLSYIGRGTERIEMEIAELVKDYPVFRLDRDAITHRGRMEEILREFAGKRGAVLVGTQMVAKGLDFPDVAVVGVVNADIGLMLPDFRAEEHTFQLLTQVAGRAGRGSSGTVIIQTFNPDSPAIKFALEQEYRPFYDYEIEKRRELSYPPFKRLVLITLSSEDEQLAYESARELSSKLLGAFRETQNVQILGPSPAPIARVKGRYRFHILVKTPSIMGFLDILRGLLPKRKGDMHIKVIPDPVDMM